MFIATVIVSVVLAVMLAMSAAMKLQQNEQAVASISGVVGVPLQYFPVLAGLELAGAAGLIIGLWFPPLGIAAAVGLVGYFAGAIIGHVRVGDTRGMASPVLPLVLSVSALVLHVLSA